MDERISGNMRKAANKAGLDLTRGKTRRVRGGTDRPGIVKVGISPRIYSNSERFATHISFDCALQIRRMGRIRTAACCSRRFAVSYSRSFAVSSFRSLVVSHGSRSVFVFMIVASDSIMFGSRLLDHV